jgi:hypothetical protein
MTAEQMPSMAEAGASMEERKHEWLSEVEPLRTAWVELQMNTNQAYADFNMAENVQSYDEYLKAIADYRTKTAEAKEAFDEAERKFKEKHNLE